MTRIAQSTGASASYDAATQSFSLAGAFDGSGFSLDHAGSTSNFFDVMTSDGRTTRFDATAGLAVEATLQRLAEERVRVGYQHVYRAHTWGPRSRSYFAHTPLLLSLH